VMTSTSRHYFETMYERDSDPWHFATSEYERRKYALTVAALPRERYHSAFEPGCSIGVLSEQLATRCDRLLSTDIIVDALKMATERLSDHRNVVVEERAIPDSWPPDVFDLVVLSEVAYYFDEDGLESVLESIMKTTRTGAHVLAVHWRGATDYPLSGDEVHEQIGLSPNLRNMVHHVETAFRLDVWERA
jgi:cyclopropane fatty-acyl-phospholipid synthase-like methyltransferase